MGKIHKPAKQQITKHQIRLIIVTAVITVVVSGVLKLLWNQISIFVLPPDVRILVTQCVIRRNSPSETPICQLELIAQNSSGKYHVSAHLTKIELGDRPLELRVPAGKYLVSLDPGASKPLSIELKDEILGIFLKTPMSAMTAQLALDFQYTGSERSEVFRFGDTRLTKCTYWQTPVFGSVQEAESYGAIMLSWDQGVWYHNSAGVPGVASENRTIFVDSSGKRDFDQRPILSELMRGRSMVPLYEGAFRRKYGGVYLGLLATDTSHLVSPPLPRDVLGESNAGYDSLVGIPLGNWVSEAREFVHLSYDYEELGANFERLQMRSQVFLYILYEERQNIEETCSRLEKMGYRLDREYGGFWDLLSRTARDLAPPESVPMVVGKISDAKKRITVTLNAGGYLVVCPERLDDKLTNLLLNDIDNATGITSHCLLTLDLAHIKSRPPSAPFSSPVLVLVHTSDTTRAIHLDSIAMGGQGDSTD